MARGNILRPKQAQKKLSIGNTKFWDLVRADPTFPRLINLGPRTRAQYEDELDAWLESKRSQAV
jgi:predicted DNA-binding transcriptional regulator AlpA